MRKQGEIPSDSTDIWREAEALFQKMRPMIIRLASKMLKIDSTLDQEDLLLQARLALREACLKYERERLSIGQKKIIIMKRETYAFWYLQKFFQKNMDADRILYEVFDQEGNPLTSLYGGEYTKRKKHLPCKHSFRSRTVFSDTTFFKDRDRKSSDTDSMLPSTLPERNEEEEEDVSLTLSRIYSRICSDDE